MVAVYSGYSEAYGVQTIRLRALLDEASLVMGSCPLDVLPTCQGIFINSLCEALRKMNIEAILDRRCMVCYNWPSTMEVEMVHEYFLRAGEVWRAYFAGSISVDKRDRLMRALRAEFAVIFA